MTVPKIFIEQNHLRDGSQVEVSVDGSRMTINAPIKCPYKLDDLLAEMPDGKLPMVESWDDMIPTGKEVV